MKETIDTSKFGIVIVDMQPTYLRRIFEEDKKDLIRNQQALLETCLLKDIPVIAFEGQEEHWVNYVETIPEIKEKIEQLKKKRIFEKRSLDGFSKYPMVNQQLSDWGIKTLCFTGIHAAACVMETAEGALKQGYGILTAGDLLEDRTGRAGGVMHARNWFAKEGTCHKSYTEILARLN